MGPRKKELSAILIAVVILANEAIGPVSGGLNTSLARIQDTQETTSVKEEKARIDRGPNRTLPEKRRPIVLVPGDGGSQLFAKLDKPDVVHYFCDRKTDTYFNLWLNMALLVPFVLDCWIDNMRLEYNYTSHKTRNSPGVDIITPGFGNTTTIEYVDPSQVSVTGYFNVLVNFFIANGYTRGWDIRGAPYDFRKSPTELKDYYYNDMTALIQETYHQQDNCSVILICHSMGCPVMLHYLNNKTQEWKDTYIHSFVTLAAPWGGAVKALKAFTSGDNLGVIVVPTLTIRKDERTFPSLAHLMPSDKFWGHDEVLMTNGNKNYTTANYDELFKDIDYDVGHRMWLDNRNLTYELIPPAVDTHCIHGGGINTMETLEYREDKFPNHNPKIGFGDGDSTVNTRSLAGCLRWKGNNKGRALAYMNLTGVDHMSVMTDARILKYLLALATIK